MKWPLSMSFAKLVSRTADAGQARHTLPAPGFLNPDTQYFWHVRARDEKGVWGPWSKTWSFTPRGPAPPQDIRLEYDRGGNRGTLHWTPSSLGRKPVAYRVYASDEKGFSVSDRPYEITVGRSEALRSPFPSNFVAETSTTELDVLGPDAAANKAYYRVVAVDAKQRRSGPSDYASGPRPMIVSRPVTIAKKGAEYRYQIKAIRSLGDLRTRVVDGKEVLNYWDIEQARYELRHAPAWLKVDQATGQLSGVPDRAGAAEVVVAVRLEYNARRLDEEALKWRVEKVTSSRSEQLGSAIQRFVINAAP
jgi:hypothetical protein